jgi:hypothetical protein
MEKNRRSEIWHKSRELDRARRNKMKEAMDEYDRTVYYPAKLAIQKECGETGHTFGSLHDNGFGWTWSYCSLCGGRYDVRGPDGELKNDQDS